MPHQFGPAELAERVWLRAARLRPAAMVAVSSADGGVGRSTVVAALGSMLALAVPGPVLAVDMAPHPWGGLADRIGRSTAGTIWDTVRDLETLTSRREVERWTQPGPCGLSALVGETEVAGRRPPKHDEADAVTQTVRRLYALTVCDLLPAYFSSVWATLATADTTVLTARATPDGVQHAMRLLTHLHAAGHGSIVERAVLAVVATSRSTSRDVAAVVRQAATVIPAVVQIPFDPLLTRPEPADPRRLRKATRRALLRLAEEVITRCADPATGQAFLPVGRL
ncbi:MinD/ParA family protein [Actinoplanes sp. NPDC000266]